MSPASGDRVCHLQAVVFHPIFILARDTEENRFFNIPSSLLHRRTTSCIYDRGRGAWYTMHMPGNQTEDLYPTSHQQPAIYADKPGRIMIVDDSPEVAGALAALLRLSGHTVELFDDGR